ncbi:MAG: adenylate/guanylate cyclase domain-containing protein [Candidatus Dormibacter sp.]
MPAEERKLVPVLFADVTGLTALGERLDSERWRTILQRYFAEMAATIEAWGGTIEKFVGEAIMAVFGVPLVREDDAERALRAAFEMLDHLPQLNEGFQARR